MIRRESSAVVWLSSLVHYYLIELDGKVLTVSCRSRGFIPVSYICANSIVILLLLISKLILLLIATPTHTSKYFILRIINAHPPFGSIHKHTHV